MPPREPGRILRKRIEIAAQGGSRSTMIRALYTRHAPRAAWNGATTVMVKTKFLALTIEARDSKERTGPVFPGSCMDALNHFQGHGRTGKGAWTARSGWRCCTVSFTQTEIRFPLRGSWLAPFRPVGQGFHCAVLFSVWRSTAVSRWADKVCARVSFLQITAPELNDRVLADLLDTDSRHFCQRPYPQHGSE